MCEPAPYLARPARICENRGTHLKPVDVCSGLADGANYDPE